MAVNRNATKRDDDEIDILQAVRNWRATGDVNTPPPPAGHYPQPQVTPTVRYTGGTNYTRPRTTQRPVPTPARPTYPQPQRYYTPPVRYTGGTNYTRPRTTQRPVQPPPPPRSTYSVDPLAAAVNRWRQSTQPDRVTYDVDEPNIDYGYEAPDTGGQNFTGQGWQSPTRTTPTQPVQGQWQPSRVQPQERPQYPLTQTASLATAWTPLLWDASTWLANQAKNWDIQFDPTDSGQLGEIIGAELPKVAYDFQHGAANERRQFNINQNNRAFQERWGGVERDPNPVRRWLAYTGLYNPRAANALVDSAIDLGQGIVDDVRGTGRALAGMTVGERSGADVWQGAWDNFDPTPYTGFVGSLFNLNRLSDTAATGAMNIFSNAAAPAEYARTSLDVPAQTIAEDLGYEDTGLTNDMPLDPYIAAGLDVMGRNLISAITNPREFFSQATLEEQFTTSQSLQLFRDWIARAAEYREAVTPTPAQIATNTPEELAMHRERAWLNSLGGLRSTQETFDDLADRDVAVNTYNQNAYKAWQYAASSDDPDVRATYAEMAAENGYRAWELENLHAQDLVNRNTNILRQLLTEVALPDWTDAIAGVFSLARFTPATRRLDRVTREVMTPAEQVAAAIDDMVVTASNKADVMAARSEYNKAWNLLTVGRARAEQSTDAMVRYVASLLADVESPSDAVVLLHHLASDPRQLITGVDSSVLRSPGLLARADNDGLVRFGGMNLDRIKEPLRIYQQAAENVLASPVLRDSGPILNLNDFMVDFIDQMNGAGYRYFNVAEQAEYVPRLATSGRILSTGQPSQYVVEFLDGKKKVIGQSRPMTMAEARRLQKDVGTGVAAQSGLLNEIGQFQRSLVSHAYLYTNPAAMMNNLLGGIAHAVGDGDFAVRSNRYISDWKQRIWGTDPTVRGLEGVESAGSSASQMSGWGPFRFLKRVYGSIDEFVGNKVFFSSASRTLRELGGETLNNTLGPLLQTAGVDSRQARRIINHLHETGMQGGDLTAEFNKLLNGQTRMFSLSDVNKAWLEAVPPDGLNQLYTIIREGGAPDEVLGAVYTWAEDMATYWDDMIAVSPPPPQRHNWQKLEVVQDTAEFQQLAKDVQKYAEVSPEETQAAVKQLAEGAQEVNKNLDTLTQMVTEAADPKNRYMLYNVWGQIYDYTANVRAELMVLATDAYRYEFGTPESRAAWEKYWSTAQQQWLERNRVANTLLEQASQIIASGNVTAPRFDVWQMLERATRVDEDALWQTMRLEPQSGRHDHRLKLVIDAGRELTDVAVARTYMAARRFIEVDAFDYIVSAEHSAQLAGAQVATFLSKVRDEALANKVSWPDFFSIRNEAWRQLRQYEKAIWENATRGIVREGLGQEAATGLRFDAGPDGVVELVGPRTEAGQRTNRMGPEKTVTPTERTVWDVRREDGTITQVPDNMVPAELKAQYQGETLTEAVDEAIDLEVANIQSTYPHAEEAQRIIDEPERIPSGYEDVVNPEMRSTEYELLPDESSIGPMPETTTPIPTVDLTLTDLRRLANEAGIQTATEAGVPMDRRLLNTINKDLGTNYRGVQELTAADRARAAAALQRRAQSDTAPVLPTAQQLSVATPTTRYATPEQVQAVQAKMQPVLEKVAGRVGTTVEELVQAGNAAIQELLATPVAIQAGTGAIDEILETGEFRTVFHTGKTSPGKSTDIPFRRQAEAKGLGVAEDADAAQRPVYGYLLLNEKQREALASPYFNTGYGELTFVLKDEVRGRTTFTVGDSNTPFAGDRLVGLPLDGEVTPWGWSEEATAVWEYAESRDVNQLIDSVGYLETQTTGGVRLSDVDSVLDPNNTLSPQQIQRLEQQGIPVFRGEEPTSPVADIPATRPRQQPEMRQLDFAVPAVDFNELAKRYGISNWLGLGGRKMDEVGNIADDITRRTTQAGGTHPGELGHGAGFARQQLDNIVTYIEQNIDEILTPPGRLIGDGQNLRALQDFRTRVLPAWDNVKYAAAEYGNRMRGFTMVDFANQTRLDEILSLYMPYGFWMTRTVKNSLERAIFEPHIWRRVMQTEQAVRDVQEQTELPQRYEGTLNTGQWGGDYTKMMRFLPGKWWPLAGMFTHNDYADPESANSAFGFAMENMRAANLQGYPWWDAAIKAWDGRSDEIYPMNYAPQGRILADLILKFGGWDAANRLTLPVFFENSTARTLNNMAMRGEITHEQARWAHDYLWQLKNGEYTELIESATGAYDPAEIEAILDTAVRETAGVDLWSAVSSWASPFGIKLWDPTEQEWSGAAENYRNYGYGDENPYGSKMAKDTQKDDAALSWSKSGVWRDEEARPGISMATDAKDAEQEQLNAELMEATDAYILGYVDPDGERERPSNFEINQFKNEWMAERVGGAGEYFVTDMNTYLDERFPSAQPFEGSDDFAYQGYAPEEVRQRARVGAYYQAREELQAQKDEYESLYPDYPGDNASSSQWDTYWKQRNAYDVGKAEYEAALETRVEEIINDPAELQKLTRNYGLDLTNDYTRSLPPTMDTVFGEPRRPTGAMPELTPDMTNEQYQAEMRDLLEAGELYDTELTPMAGDPETAADIIYQERTKYMSDLEKEVRAANEEEDSGTSGGSYGRRGWRNYNRRPWVNYGRRGWRNYGRRYYGGGGGAGGNYYAPNVDPQDFSLWPNFSPRGYERPDTYPYWLDTRDIGPEQLEAWRPISWR